MSDCTPYNSDTREIQSPNYPESYPLDKKCKWRIQIPIGSFYTTGSFDYHFDCKPRTGSDPGDLQYDTLTSTGFEGGSVSVNNFGNDRICKGTWPEATSSGYEQTFEFESDQIREEGTTGKFKIKFSSLKRKKYTIFHKHMICLFEYMI